MITPPIDPPFDGDDRLRPLVGEATSNRIVWVFGGLLVLSAAGLFAILEARRSLPSTSAMQPEISSVRPEISSPPDLVLQDAYPRYAELAPPAYPYPTLPAYRMRASRPNLPTAPARTNRLPPRGSPSTSAEDSPPQAVAPTSAFPFPTASSSGVVFRGMSDPTRPLSATADPSLTRNERAQAARLANPEVTVPQGTVIQAVMETALDSTRPGYVRAIVSRDVRGFDGSRILIPRGSRLYGEYKSEVAQGQSRALVEWKRLLRPDGVTMDIDSPATDPLGRAGVQGKVNSHFFARFGGAILQSVLDVGVGVATRPLRDGVIVNLPQGSQALGLPPVTQNVSPTLTVPQGKSVSVYVARDLDFSAVEL